MKKLFSLLLISLLWLSPAIADSIFVPPTSNGTAAVGQLPGTTTNDSAAAGKVGEYISGSRSLGSALGLTTATVADIVTISITAGDWDITGIVGFNGAATTTVTAFDGGISLVSATVPSSINNIFIGYPSATTVFVNYPTSHSVPTLRVSTASTINVYLVADATFAVSTCSAFGKLEARRVR